MTTLAISPAKRKGERIELGTKGREGGGVEISRSICGPAKNNNCSFFVFGHFVVWTERALLSDYDSQFQGIFSLSCSDEDAAWRYRTYTGMPGKNASHVA